MEGRGCKLPGMADEISDGLSADLVKVGERLRRLRKERGWKLEDLAERTNLSRATPYAWAMRNSAVSEGCRSPFSSLDR